MYLYTLENDYKFFAQTLIPIRFENKWIRANEVSFTIKKGYSWNGASPKKMMFNKVIGTPEGPIGDNGLPATYHATLIHDALYQFMPELEKLGYTRKQADQEFLYEMQFAGFKYAKLYYYGVRMFGWMFV